MTKQPTYSGPDAALLWAADAFHDFHDRAMIAFERATADRARVEAMPDCPPFKTPAEDREGYERREAFLREQGAFGMYDLGNEMLEELGKVANKIFATPAQTAEGVRSKLRIAYLAVGDGPGTNTGDEDLNAFQDLADPWMVKVIEDLERLADSQQVVPIVGRAEP